MIMELSTPSLHHLSLQMSLSAVSGQPLMHAIASKTTLTHLSLTIRPDQPAERLASGGPSRSGAAVTALEAMFKALPLLSNLQALRHLVHPRMPPESRIICASVWLQLQHLESFTLDWPHGNRAAVELFTHVSNSMNSLTALRVIGLDEHDPSFGHDEALLLFHTVRSSAILPVNLQSLSLHGVTFQQLGEGSSACAAIGRMHALRTCLLYTSPSPRDKRQSRMPSSA